MNETVGDLNKILVGTEFEKRTACIQRVLDQYNIKTLGQLENSTRYLGSRICGHSAWELISTIRERTLNPPPEPKKVVRPAPKPKPIVVEKANVVESKATKKEVVKVEKTKEDKE